MIYKSISNFPEGREKHFRPFIIKNDIFNDIEIDKIIKYCEEAGVKEGLTFSGLMPEKRNSNVAFHGRDENTSWIFDRLNESITEINDNYYNFDLNGYESFQYTTYFEQGLYDWHMDSYMLMRSENNKKTFPHRKLSMTLCLNEDYLGGDLLINRGDQNDCVNIPKKKGKAIFFPSFMCHKVAPVTKGIRRSLVVWVTGPKWV
jgi:PKHD-type hydroxylase